MSDMNFDGHHDFNKVRALWGPCGVYCIKKVKMKEKNIANYWAVVQ